MRVTQNESEIEFVLDAADQDEAAAVAECLRKNLMRFELAERDDGRITIRGTLSTPYPQEVLAIKGNVGAYEVLFHTQAHLDRLSRLLRVAVAEQAPEQKRLGGLNRLADLVRDAEVEALDLKHAATRSTGGTRSPIAEERG